jgi:hypothetical protein
MNNMKVKTSKLLLIIFAFYGAKSISQRGFGDILSERK